MNYSERDTFGMYKVYKGAPGGGPGPALMGADTLIGNDVYNQAGDKLGDIKPLLNPAAGKALKRIVASDLTQFTGLELKKSVDRAMALPD